MEVKKAKIKQTSKNTKKKDIKNSSEGMMSGKQIMIMVMVMIVVFATTYILIDLVVSKNRTTSDTNTNSSSNTATNEIAFSKLLKQSEENYYVLAVVPDDTTTIYSTYLSTITSNTNSNNTLGKYYTVNMKDSVNKTYIGEETVIKEDVRDIRISDTTLFIIKKGKISKSLTGREEVLAYLKENLPKK